MRKHFHVFITVSSFLDEAHKKSLAFLCRAAVAWCGIYINMIPNGLFAQGGSTFVTNGVMRLRIKLLPCDC